MAIIESLIPALAAIIDRVLPDKRARDAAKLELIRLEGSREMAAVEGRLNTMLAEARSPDPWTSRARPGFLYVMYAMILWAIPMGLLAAWRPAAAADMARGITGYLQSLPEPLYALFGTGYLGYTVARQWGKASGTDKQAGRCRTMAGGFSERKVFAAMTGRMIIKPFARAASVAVISLLAACGGQEQPAPIASDDATTLRQQLQDTEERLRLTEQQLRDERSRAEATPQAEEAPNFRADNDPRPDNPNPSSDDNAVPPPPSGQMNEVSPHGG